MSEREAQSTFRVPFFRENFMNEALSTFRFNSSFFHGECQEWKRFSSNLTASLFRENVRKGSVCTFRFYSSFFRNMSGRDCSALSDSTAPFSGKMLGREALSTLGINSPLFIEKMSGRKAFSTFGFISSFFQGKCQEGKHSALSDSSWREFF
jgi:hypothetical protein